MYNIMDGENKEPEETGLSEQIFIEVINTNPDKISEILEGVKGILDEHVDISTPNIPDSLGEDIQYASHELIISERGIKINVSCYYRQGRSVVESFKLLHNDTVFFQMDEVGKISVNIDALNYAISVLSGEEATLSEGDTVYISAYVIGRLNEFMELIFGQSN